MVDVSKAWTVVQIAELVRASEELLLRALDTLDVDVRAAMPADSRWALSGRDADDLCMLLTEHGELAARMCQLVEQLPGDGVSASYADVRDGAAAALADGILDADTVVTTAGALDVRAGWAALADALVSTDVRSAWGGLGVDELLSSFRMAKRRVVTRVSEEAGVGLAARWCEMDDASTRRLAAALRSFAGSRDA